MIRFVQRTLATLFCLIIATQIGCARRVKPVIHDRVTIFLPGVAGDGSVYDGAIDVLSNNKTEPVEVFTWGAPKAFFFQNFSNKSVHDTAERELATRLNALAGKRIMLVGHSAGCGVILGALGQTQTRVANVVLLSPSVSPGYDLVPAVAKIGGRLQVYFSDKDTTFLRWRTSHFGTYDRVYTPAAGNCGFDLSHTPSRNSYAYRAIQLPPRLAIPV